jgi:CxxC-x17-CxxC domain-containing protein
MSTELAVFAETTFRNKFRKFGIKMDDRRRHMYLIGKTGMGKSTILENMIVGDIRAGHGVCVVDPHGDLAEKVIKFVPSNRINDVIYFNPADYEYPIAFNVVEQVEPHLRHLVASGLIGVFQKLWADSWGPRLEYILRNTILAILDYPGSTLLAVTRMLSDKKFRKKVIEKIEDPVVRAFWVNEFAGYADKFASEAVSPIQNKVGQFLSTALIRNIVGQVKSTINMREIMDTGKILILNLSKGRIGEDSSSLLGNMVITKIQLAAMSRVDIEEPTRKDFYLYIDEFQNFTTDSFANILSEARKYRLNLILAHQYVEQLSDIVRNAVFGNVGTLVVFRVGAADAEALEPEFSPTFLAEDILNLPKYEFYLKLMIDGIASEPFSARGLPPLRKDEETHNVDKMIAVSRERYAKDKATVEEKIARWHNSDDEAPSPSSSRAETQTADRSRQTPSQPNYSNQASQRPAPAQRPDPRFDRSAQAIQPSETREAVQPRQNLREPEQNRENVRREAGTNTLNNRDSLQKFSANCSRCGKETKLAFKPDGIRPVFCKDCLVIARDEKRREQENRKKLKEEELRRLTQVQEPSPRPPVQPAVRPEPPRVNNTANIADGGGLSLSEALSRNPVNFKGREIPKKEVLTSEVQADVAPEIVLNKKIVQSQPVPASAGTPAENSSASSVKDITPSLLADEFDIEIDRSVDL